MATAVSVAVLLLWIWAAAASAQVQPHELRLARYAGTPVELARVAELRQAPWTRLLEALSRRVRRRRRRTAQARWNMRELDAAGIDPARVEAGRILAGMLGAAIGVVLLAATHSALAVLLAVLFALIGYLIPPIALSLRLEARRAAIRAQLPDTLDFIAVATRAGQSLDQALALVAAEMEGPFARLVAMTQREILLGAPRDQALRLLGERSGVAEVRELAGHLIRSMAYGASLADTIQREARHLRALLRARARQRSAEAAVRLLFPLALFYIPALFLVTIGPVAIRLVAALGPHLRR